MLEARDTNFETIFYGPGLLFILLLADSHACLQQQSRRLEAVYSRLGSCYGFHKGSKALNLSVKTTTTNYHETEIIYKNLKMKHSPSLQF